MNELETRLEQVRRDKKLLEEEELKIQEEIKNKSIPLVSVGQVYKHNDFKYMVASMGSSKCGTAGLPIVGASFYSGCYSSDLLIGERTFVELKKVLIEKKAKYLGRFNEVFKERN